LPQSVREIAARIERKIDNREIPVVLLTGSTTRFFLRQILESSLPNVFPLSHNEVPSGVKILSLGTI